MHALCYLHQCPSEEQWLMNAHKVQVIRYRHRLGHHKPHTGQLTLQTKCKSLADQAISNFREGRRYKHIVKCVCVCEYV